MCYDKLKRSATLNMVKAIPMSDKAYAIVVKDQDGDYWVGRNLPIITKSMGPIIRKELWRQAPHVAPMGPMTDEKLTILAARAFFCHDEAAIDEFEEHSRKLMRRAVNTLWHRYNSDYTTAIELTEKMNIPQWRDKPKGGNNGREHETDNGNETANHKSEDNGEQQQFRHDGAARKEMQACM